MRLKKKLDRCKGKKEEEKRVRQLEREIKEKQREKDLVSPKMISKTFFLLIDYPKRC